MKPWILLEIVNNSLLVTFKQFDTQDDAVEKALEILETNYMEITDYTTATEHLCCARTRLYEVGVYRNSARNVCIYARQPY